MGYSQALESDRPHTTTSGWIQLEDRFIFIFLKRSHEYFMWSAISIKHISLQQQTLKYSIYGKWFILNGGK